MTINTNEYFYIREKKIKITLSNFYPSYYNEEKSVVNVLKYNSYLLEMEKEIYHGKELSNI